MLNNGKNYFFCKRTKRAYLRSATSESDNKLKFVERLGTRLLLVTLTCFKSMTSLYEKFYNFMKYMYKNLDIEIIKSPRT